ncbi:MAG TPA: endo alpha-1,4 polygalactosaminidase [Mycobacterium sp.]
MTSRSFRVRAALLVAIASFMTSCSTAEPSTPAVPTTTSTTASQVNSALRLPDPKAGFDYQLGGGYTPPPGVTIVGRDRTNKPAGLGYDICYVNGFQTQPDDSKEFARLHPDLVVQVDGKPLSDPGWPDEYLYDTSTDAKRAGLAAVVKPWIDGCRSAGFDAVEIDNLDSYTRSEDALTVDDNIAMATIFAKQAHDAGLAIAQKNTVEESKRLRAAGYDFAVTESCFKYDECAGYTEHYPVVLDIEYTDELGEGAFPAACKSPDRAPAMIMRDHYLVTPGQDGYFYRGCPAS